MQSDQFLKTAERLAQGATEGDWRSATSRAYYAVYHFLLETFRRARLSLPRKVSHETMQQALAAATGPAMKAIADMFEKLLESRKKADYKLSQPFVQFAANTDVAAAAVLVNDFQAVLTSPDGPQAVFDLRTYFNRALGLPPPTP